MNHASRLGILNRKTKSVKFKRAAIFTGELTNGEKITNEGRGDENVIEGEVCCGGG